VKVLWISRHRPGTEESELLSSVLGGVEILPISGTVPNTWALTSLLDVHEPGAVVATLPFDMQEVLSNELKHRGMRPLIRPIYRHRRRVLGIAPDQLDQVSEWDFQGFEEVLEITVSTRPLVHPKNERTDERTDARTKKQPKRKLK
jgi:hypothetical protein